MRVAMPTPPRLKTVAGIGYITVALVIAAAAAIMMTLGSAVAVATVPDPSNPVPGFTASFGAIFGLLCGALIANFVALIVFLVGFNTFHGGKEEFGKPHVMAVRRGVWSFVLTFLLALSSIILSIVFFFSILGSIFGGLPGTVPDRQEILRQAFPWLVGLGILETVTALAIALAFAFPIAHLSRPSYGPLLFLAGLFLVLRPVVSWAFALADTATIASGALSNPFATFTGLGAIGMGGVIGGAFNVVGLLLFAFAYTRARKRIEEGEIQPVVQPMPAIPVYVTPPGYYPPYPPQYPPQQYPPQQYPQYPQQYPQQYPPPQSPAQYPPQQPPPQQQPTEQAETQEPAGEKPEAKKRPEDEER